MFSRCELDSDVRGHHPVPFVNDSRTTAGNPELNGDVALDFFACNYEDHPVTRVDEGSITAVELGSPRARGGPTALVCELRDGEILAFVGCRSPVVARADPSLVQRRHK